MVERLTVIVEVVVEGTGARGVFNYDPEIDVLYADVFTRAMEWLGEITG